MHCLFSSILRAEEVMIHSKCRRLDLPPQHPLRSALKMSNPSPWCYVIRKVGNIAAEKCFDACKGAPREEKTLLDRTQYGARQVLKNYNDLLIENIRKYYKSYAWGDVSYYRWVQRLFVVQPFSSAFLNQSYSETIRQCVFC
ncbi:hypothetical protein ANCCAN_21567 [Ancylostoma caninum]|uniref:Kringle-like domain-containing protein n=1 Tax=Ancylostoma caninum TaxID=29170 RepID=A0A368FK67_ANCCA|nr:hypothetical protein ANCCAN_21567 [Ancylostoma caninum]